MSREKQIEEMTESLCDIQCKGLKCNVCDRYGCEYRMLAEALYNAGYRKQEWISVDERLPESTDLVLCIWERSDGSHYGFARYQPHGVWYVSNEGMPNVTHWMPLPEAPKMKGGVTAESAIRAVQEAALELENTPPDNLLGIGSTMQF